MLKPRVQGQVFMTNPNSHLLLEPTWKPYIGTNILLYIDPKLEPWKNTLENKGSFLNRQSDFLKSSQVDSTW